MNAVDPARTELRNQASPFSLAGQKRELFRGQRPVLNQFFGRPQLLHRSAPRPDSGGRAYRCRLRPSLWTAILHHFAQLRGHWAIMECALSIEISKSPKRARLMQIKRPTTCIVR